MTTTRQVQSGARLHGELIAARDPVGSVGLQHHAQPSPLGITKSAKPGGRHCSVHQKSDNPIRKVTNVETNIKKFGYQSAIAVVEPYSHRYGQ
jgi:hypothetical protein